MRCESEEELLGAEEEKLSSREHSLCKGLVASRWEVKEPLREVAAEAGGSHRHLVLNCQVCNF